MAPPPARHAHEGIAGSETRGVAGPCWAIPMLTCRRFVHSTQLRRCRRRFCLTLPPSLETRGVVFAIVAVDVEAWFWVSRVSSMSRQTVYMSAAGGAVSVRGIC